MLRSSWIRRKWLLNTGTKKNFSVFSWNLKSACVRPKGPTGGRWNMNCRIIGWVSSRVGTKHMRVMWWGPHTLENIMHYSNAWKQVPRDVEWLQTNSSNFIHYQDRGATAIQTSNSACSRSITVCLPRKCWRWGCRFIQYLLHRTHFYLDKGITCFSCLVHVTPYSLFCSGTS